MYSAYTSESNTLQQVSIGFDPSTGYGMLIGEIAEIMVFDRTLSKSEQEKIEGYLAHKWSVVDDLAQTGFKLTKGLRLYYPFDETDGSVAQDYSFEMRHAEVIDASLDVDGKFGSGIEFDTFEANESLAEMAQLSLYGVKFTQANWTVSLYLSLQLKFSLLTHKWVNIFYLW